MVPLFHGIEAEKKQAETAPYDGLIAADMRALPALKDAEITKQQSTIISQQSTIQNEQLNAVQVSKELQAAIAERDKYRAISEELLRLSRIRQFAAKSEKTPNQGQLFDEAELEVAVDDLAEQVPDDTPADTPAVKAGTSKGKTRQRGFAAELNRIRHELLLTDAEKEGASKVFFTKVKEELEYIKPQLNVIEYWQEKAVFEAPSTTTEAEVSERIVAAPRPVHPLGKCFVTTSMLAYIITSKYADGLPLYRLDNLLARHGHTVGRSNMANWIIRLDEVFKPLMTLMREQQN